MAISDNCETERALLEALFDVGQRCGAGGGFDRLPWLRWQRDVIQAVVFHEPIIQRSLLADYKKEFSNG